MKYNIKSAWEGNKPEHFEIGAETPETQFTDYTPYFSWNLCFSACLNKSLCAHL